jgi:diguanylate cyclase (GGDEF)-like protein
MMRRKRIGLQTSRLEYGYGVKIWQGAVECAASNDADLIVFPGRNLEAPHGFDYQYNRIFELMSSKNLDALILVTTLVMNYVDEEGLRAFSSRFRDFPLVSIGAAIPGVPSILVDNRSGVRDIVRHLVTKHGSRRIAFIKGPVTNWEANERFAAYKEELEELGIPYDESLVGQGDFTSHSARPAIREILSRTSKLPDAFLFANDEMAIRGMQLLQEQGYKIPYMTKIAGFDDISESSTQPTPLTTIRQPLMTMAKKAVSMALDIISGAEVPETTILPTEPVIRSSCGCLAHCVDDLLALNRIVHSKNVDTNDRDSCLSLVMESLRNGRFEYLRDIDNRRDKIRIVMEALLDLSRTGSKESEKSNEDFLGNFGDILRDESHSGMHPGEWQYILPAISDAIDLVFPGTVDPQRLKLLVHACIVLAADMRVVAHEASNYESNRLTRVLHEVLYSLSSIMRIEDLVETLKVQLPRLGISTFFLSRYEREWYHSPKTAWEIPNTCRLITAVVNGEELELNDSEKLEYPSDLVLPPDLYEDTKRRTFAVYPLFFREMHYGTIIYELTHRSGFVFESLTTQISGILKAITLYDAKEKAEDNLRQAMMELENFNQQLSNLSLTDELTGLYNRRGFLKLAAQQLSLTKQMRKNALLIFGDIDGLKTINDTYGHAEGDFIIKAAADILQKTFRTMDVIARLGGDEFTIFASNTNEKQIGYFEARISDMVEAFNAQSGKPYKLSISLGCAECRPFSESTLSDFMREADARLYARKAAKKQHLEKG